MIVVETPGTLEATHAAIVGSRTPPTLVPAGVHVRAGTDAILLTNVALCCVVPKTTIRHDPSRGVRVAAIELAPVVALVNAEVTSRDCEPPAEPLLAAVTCPSAFTVRLVLV